MTLRTAPPVLDRLISRTVQVTPRVSPATVLRFNPRVSVGSVSIATPGRWAYFGSNLDVASVDADGLSMPALGELSAGDMFTVASGSYTITRTLTA